MQKTNEPRFRIKKEEPRFKVEKQRGLELAEAFFAASRHGDMTALRTMLSADVSIHADGGGKRPAFSKPVLGLEPVYKLHQGLAAHFAKHPSELVRVDLINGLPGFVTREADGELQTTALDIENGQITAIYIVRNPDKLKHLH